MPMGEHSFLRSSHLRLWLTKALLKLIYYRGEISAAFRSRSSKSSYITTSEHKAAEASLLKYCSTAKKEEDTCAGTSLSLLTLSSLRMDSILVNSDEAEAISFAYDSVIAYPEAPAIDVTSDFSSIVLPSSGELEQEVKHDLRASILRFLQKCWSMVSSSEVARPLIPIRRPSHLNFRKHRH